MHRLNSLLGCSLLVLSACATAGRPPGASAPGATASAADSVSAHEAAVGFLAAFDSLQWERFSAYMADDVTMFFPFSQVPNRADGRQAVESVFRQFMDAQRRARTEAGRPMVQGLAPRDLRVQMLGANGAVASFHLGNETPARRSIIFRREADGEWKVAHWHASPSPRPSGS